MVTFFAGDQLAAADLNAIDLRKPQYCKVINTGAPTVNIVTGGSGVITFNTDAFDVPGWHSTSSNTSRITPTIHGVYELKGVVAFSANATGRRGCGVRLNNTQNYYGDLTVASTAVNIYKYAEQELELNGSTDFVELVGFQDSGGTLTVADHVATYFSARLLYDLSF